jgi:SOS response regulatory protein OraA/RecX
MNFCFRYLYDSEYDSADDWTDYSEIEEYFLKRGYTKEQINEEFQKIE